MPCAMFSIKFSSLLEFSGNVLSFTGFRSLLDLSFNLFYILGSLFKI